MHKLQECSTLQEAETFLRGSSPTFRKTVETAILLKQHPDPAQRILGESFMQIAIKELDNAEQPTPKESGGLKVKGEHFVKEETLPGGNKSGTDGSEQSSADKPQDEGTEEPVGDLGNPEMSTENQMTEAFGQPPMGGPPQGGPPQMGGPPGLDPSILQQMAPQMQPLPSMNTPQQVQQMQYTVKQYMEAYVKPIREQVLRLTKANTFLSSQIKEMQTSSVGLDITKFSKESKIPRIQEITLSRSVDNLNPGEQAPRIYEKAYNLEEQRQKIADIDKMISSNGSQPYG